MSANNWFGAKYFNQKSKDFLFCLLCTKYSVFSTLYTTYV